MIKGESQFPVCIGKEFVDGLLHRTVKYKYVHTNRVYGTMN